MNTPNADPGIFSRVSLSERNWLLRALRDETFGGILLLIAAVAAMIIANSQWREAYETISTTEIGPAAIHLNLQVQVWAADGLLAVFFFIAGLELKHELVLGTLANRAKAAVPVAAALGGMIIPALIYLALNSSMADGNNRGWGIPMATDIAFALAVLAVVGRNLPVALRAFLLTLAVVDDLGAILVIALFYSKGFHPEPFVAAIALLVLYWWLQKKRVRSSFIYVPLALVIWYLTHESGVHATVAGVAMGMLTRVRPDPGEEESPAERLQHRIQPFSAGFCVPVFAFFSAGVFIGGLTITEELRSPVALGILLGLFLGKPIGVVGGAWLAATFTRARLSSQLAWRDIMAVGLIAGIGFTVSLLITELAFYDNIAVLDQAKLAVLGGSVISAIAASFALISRSRAYRRIAEEEEIDADNDGVPDVYQRGGSSSG